MSNKQSQEPKGIHTFIINFPIFLIIFKYKHLVKQAERMVSQHSLSISYLFPVSLC